MTSWTRWQLLRDDSGHGIKSGALTYNGPACYVIALRKGDHGKFHSVYVGDTATLLARMRSHANDDVTTYRQIHKAVRNGYTDWFCFHRCPTAGTAKDMAIAEVSEWWNYPWNSAGMPY